MSSSTNMSPIMIALRLTAICFAAVVLLVFINAITAPKIAENERMAIEAANKLLMPDADSFSEASIYFTGLSDADKSAFSYIEAFNSSKEVIGYIVTSQGSGYGGKMKVLVAFDTDLKILNVKLLNNDETPGLGKKAEKQKYMDKFVNTNTADKPFPKSKNDLSSSDRDATTGATMTFNGVVQGISRAVELLSKELKK